MPVVPVPPIVPPSAIPGGTTSFRGIDIVTMALEEIGAYAQGEAPSADDASSVLKKLNRMLDAWAADGRFVYSVNFVQYTIVPNLQPHTIGPGGTFQVNQRPVKLDAANIILPNTNPSGNIRYPLNVRDDEWWQQKRAYNVQGTLPTDVYYTPNWPLGQLFIWPVPQIAYLLELWTWNVVDQIQLKTPVSLPPGYLDAVVYSLAVAICPSFERPIDPLLLKLEVKAVERIQGNNMQAPRMSTRDAGMPHATTGTRPTFNYRTGGNR